MQQSAVSLLHAHTSPLSFSPSLPFSTANSLRPTQYAEGSDTSPLTDLAHLCLSSHCLLYEQTLFFLGGPGPAARLRRHLLFLVHLLHPFFHTSEHTLTELSEAAPPGHTSARKSARACQQLSCAPRVLTPFLTAHKDTGRQTDALPGAHHRNNMHLPFYAGQVTSRAGRTSFGPNAGCPA